MRNPQIIMKEILHLNIKQDGYITLRSSTFLAAALA
jgi:hypothetical protein